MTIIDHGKDYGFGRYCIHSDNLHEGDNDFSKILKLASMFSGPCEGCSIAPVDCMGVVDCKKTFGRWQSDNITNRRFK